MDNLESLYYKKEYQLVLDLTKDSTDPRELLMRISCLIITCKSDEALDEIEKNQSIIEKQYQKRLMKIHFELLLSKGLFDEARLALKHYEDLPYVSQEVEELMREMKDRIEDESHPKSHHSFNIEDIYDVLEKETDSAKISQVLFNLKNYNLNIYIDSLKIFMKREDVNPNFRTYALILLIDEKYDEEVGFLSRLGLISVVPTKLNPPFMSNSFNETCRLITDKCNHDVSMIETALHLFNCYIIDTYPEDIYSVGEEMLSSAFIRIAESYLNKVHSSSDEKVADLASKIQKIIESTPEIRL